jgi:hypothetical protein
VLDEILLAVLDATEIDKVELVEDTLKLELELETFPATVALPYNVSPLLPPHISYQRISLWFLERKESLES